MTCAPSVLKYTESRPNENGWHQTLIALAVAVIGAYAGMALRKLAAS